MYIRLIIVTLLSLLIVRYLLKYLGVLDFGIFNLINGVILLMGFISTAISIGVQRSISYSIPLGKDKILESYNSNLVLVSLVASILLVTALVFSKYIVQSLNIPIDKVDSTLISFKVLVVIMFLTQIGSINTALIQANEDFHLDALLSIIFTTLNLASAYSLQFINDNQIITYVYSLLFITITVELIKLIYTRKRYLNVFFDSNSISYKEILLSMSFIGWMSIGTASASARVNGTNIALNLYFGPIVNSAYAIANQTASKVQLLSTNIIATLKPMIYKCESRGDREELLSLSTFASKCGLVMIMIPGLAFIFEMETVLNLWLGDVPEYTSTFCKVMVLTIMVNMMTNGLQVAIQAIGDMKLYQLVVGGLSLLSLPIIVILASQGVEAEPLILVALVIEAIAVIARVYILSIKASLNWKVYIIDVIFSAIIMGLLLGGILYIETRVIEPSIIRVLYSTAISVISGAILTYLIMLNRDEKMIVKKILMRR